MDAQPVQDWKAFGFQVATIACGVLLALGIAAAAERFQHGRQRKNLEYSLHWEAEKNRDIASRDAAFLDTELKFYGSLLEALRAGHGKPTALPTKPQASAFEELSTTAWGTAKEDGAMSLIPAQAEHLNAVLYRQADLAQQAGDAVSDSAETLQELGCGPSTCAPDATQLNALTALAVRNFSLCEEAKARLATFTKANEAVLTGKAKSEEELIAAVKA